MDISSIAENYNLKGESLFYLNSIVWQYEQAGMDPKKDLRNIACIVSSYFHPEKAAQKIDQTVKIYIEKKKSKQPVGSFKEVRARELQMRQRGISLSIEGLKNRLETLLLKNSN